MSVVFDDVITDKKPNKKLSPIVTELFLGGRNLNVSLVFISQSYFKMLKVIRLNAMYYFTWRFLTNETFNE